MENSSKEVDGFRFLPPGLAAWILTFIPDDEFNGPIPWTPMDKPLSEARVALVTSAGISLKSDPPFDMEREKLEPDWGDPTFRVIPKETTAGDVNVNHLHINTSFILEDLDVMLEITVLEIEGGRVRLGFEADTRMPIHRREVWDRICNGELQPNPAGAAVSSLSR